MSRAFLMILAVVALAVLLAFLVPPAAERGDRKDAERRSASGSEPAEPGVLDPDDLPGHRPPVDHRGPLAGDLELAGRVTGPTGASLQRVRLTVRPKAKTAPSGVEWWVVSNADGRWSVPGLQPGWYEVGATLDRDGRRWVGRADAEAGDRSVVVALTEVDAGSLRLLVVRIVDAGGRPVPRGRVSLRVPAASAAGGPPRAFSEGEFVFDLAGLDGLSLWVVVSDVADDLAPAVVGPFEARPQEVDVRLDAPRSVRGRVVDSRDEPVPGVVVDARLVGEAGTIWGRHGSVTTDATGAFEIDGLGDLPYRLVVTAAGVHAAPPPTDVRGGAEGVLIRLREGGRATLRVVDDAGEAIGGARVSVHGFDPDRRGGAPVFRRKVTADAEGVVRVVGLAPGLAFRLLVQPPEDRDDLRTARDESWKVADGTVVLEPAFALTGRVESSAGDPVGGVVVRYQRIDDEDPRWRSTRSGVDGAFEIKGIEDGEFWIWPSGSSSDAPAEKMRVRAGATAIVLRVGGGDTITVRLDGWGEGTPVTLWLRPDDETRGVQQRVSHGSEVTFGGVESGRSHSVFGRALDGSSCAHRSDLMPGTPAVVLAATKGAVLSGRLSTPTGEAPQRASVEVTVHGARVTVEAKGSEFRIAAIPMGTYRVRVAASGEGGRRWTGSAEATTGSSVEIALR